MEIFNICILIAPVDADCFVKDTASNGIAKQTKSGISKLSS